MERLIRLYTCPGDRVLDPFCGIGSSGVAAKRLGRSWVGLDTSVEYCGIAEERIEAVGDNAEDIDLSDELAGFCHEFARVMATGAHESGALEVRRFQLSHAAGPWERYRRTHANHVTVGAFGAIQGTDGSRVGWTTGHGPEPTPDPEEMVTKTVADDQSRSRE